MCLSVSPPLNLLAKLDAYVRIVCDVHACTATKDRKGTHSQPDWSTHDSCFMQPTVKARDFVISSFRSTHNNANWCAPPHVYAVHTRHANLASPARAFV
eukprot:1021341-Pleurochrysis_carterae.AAC.1